MAGHSKWANIKHKKERADAAKGKLFSRATKEIISAVKQGGADPKANAKLRLAIQKAKAVNLPNDNIERNIKRAVSNDQADYFEISYELYGMGGVGIIVEVMTDNKNRSASDIRIATNKRGGSLASPGAVMYNFEKKGVIQVQKEGVDEEKLFSTLSEIGASDFDALDDCYVVITPPDQLFQVKEGLETAGYSCSDANLEMLPKTCVSCDEETKEQNLALIEWLEGIDDVDAVYHNME